MNKLTKLQNRLRAALAAKQFYEAHQILRTLHARLSAERKFAELLEQIHSTVLTLCEAREYTSAIDLAELYVETLRESGATLSTENSEILLTFFSNLPAKLNSDSPMLDRRGPFLNKTIDWAIDSTQGKPELLRAFVYLQQKFADIFFSEGNEKQGERYALAAEYLLNEVDRLGRTPTPIGEAQNNEMDSAATNSDTAKKIDSEIDLD